MKMRIKNNHIISYSCAYAVWQQIEASYSSSARLEVGKGDMCTWKCEQWVGKRSLPQQLTFMVDMTVARRFVLHMQALSIGATFSTDMHSGSWSAA